MNPTAATIWATAAHGSHSDGSQKAPVTLAGARIARRSLDAEKGRPKESGTLNGG